TVRRPGRLSAAPGAAAGGAHRPPDRQLRPRDGRNPGRGGRLMAARKPARKAAAKPRATASRPAVQEVTVRYNYGTHIARALGKTCSCTSSEALAVRGLARKLGYSSHADVRYVRTNSDRSQIFEIVEVSHA